MKCGLASFEAELKKVTQSSRILGEKIFEPSGQLFFSVVLYT